MRELFVFSTFKKGVSALVLSEEEGVLQPFIQFYLKYSVGPAIVQSKTLNLLRLKIE